MQNQDFPDQVIYSKPVIEFVTVAAEICRLLENVAEESKETFVRKALKMLPLMYLKTSLLETIETETTQGIERFVTEADYLFIRESVEQILGPDDSFLEVFHPDMSLSDTPIVAFVSENLADIYQEIKDFIANYQIADQDIMQEALATCVETFGEHWGQKLLNVLRALHAVRYSDNFGDEQEDNYQIRSKDKRNRILDFQNENDEDEINQFLI